MEENPTKVAGLQHRFNFIRTYAKLNRNAYLRTVQTLTIIGPVRLQTAPTTEARKFYAYYSERHQHRSKQQGGNICVLDYSQ